MFAKSWSYNPVGAVFKMAAVFFTVIVNILGSTVGVIRILCFDWTSLVGLDMVISQKFVYFKFCSILYHYLTTWMPTLINIKNEPFRCPVIISVILRLNKLANLRSVENRLSEMKLSRTCLLYVLFYTTDNTVQVGSHIFIIQKCTAVPFSSFKQAVPPKTCYFLVFLK